ncbi:MAG: hypothetical protein HY905_14675 [Deltaproteobacteria bacterium]|nr:hypothetical protein [Deltaproteobacteria bacterium]
MGDAGHIVPPELGSSFHEYDRVLRQNLALRRVHGPLPGEADRPPTGLTLAVLQEENQRLRTSLEKRGLEPPHVTEGAVQPTTMIPHARRHVAVDDPKICPQCGDHRKKSATCRCGYSWAGGLRRGGGSPRGRMPWDAWLAWGTGAIAVLVGLFWLLQPLIR